MTERAELPTDPEGWAKRLKSNWERRAQHASRDFFVASNPGWSDPETWERYARQDLELFLTDFDRERLKKTDVLEIGCGSGRLAEFLGPIVGSYSGFDIAPSMVDGARERCKELDNCRFEVGGGLGVPEALRDRRYGLILCVAVFIHCPKSVIESNLMDAWTLRTADADMRFQVLADPTNDTGLESPPQPEVSEQVAETLETEVKQVLDERTEEEIALSTEEHYLGHPFLYDEVREMAEQQTQGDVALYRGDLGSIFGRVR